MLNHINAKQLLTIKPERNKSSFKYKYCNFLNQNSLLSKNFWKKKQKTLVINVMMMIQFANSQNFHQLTHYENTNFSASNVLDGAQEM